MKKHVLKRLLAIILVFAMSAPVMGHLGTNAGEVQAAEEEKTVGYVIVPSTAVDITEPTDETQPKVMSVKTDDATYGQYADYIFAGWYTDAAATVAAASGTTGAYARFVPNDVLTTKVQVTNGIVTNTENENYKDKYVLRFVSSVDSTDYQYAGFELSYDNQTLESKTYKAFKRIDSTTGATDNSVDTYDFSPKVVDTKSEYFITGKYPVAEADKAVNYTVRAYWMTKDGTKVYGRERCVSVEDGIDNNRLNLTVDGELTIGGEYSAFYNNQVGAQVPITGSNVEVLTSENGYSNIRLKGASRDTKSVTTITITDGNNTIATGLYRNLYTKYTGTADTTWYDMYSATDDEFVVATSADLYGLATITKERDYDFDGDKIYVVSDIDANPEKLELLEKENYLKWYTYDEDKQKVYQTAPSYSWTPIGISSEGTDLYFKGTFDGQGHSIKGIYINGGQYVGLFRCVDAKGTVKDVKLKNSYIKTSNSDVGSIVANMKGTLDSVYSDAIIECGKLRSGGLIGASRGTHSMTNCWYAGKITNISSTGAQTGGLVGTVMQGVTLTMTSCLNTGTVDVSAFVSGQPFAGGLVGRISASTKTTATLVVRDSLNAGEIKENVSNGYASIACVSETGILDIDTTYAWEEASDKYLYQASGGQHSGTIQHAQDIFGPDAQDNMSELGWENTWTTVAHGIPVLSAFEKEVFDTSWYDEDKSVYVLKDKGDLYGLAKLSVDTNFEDKTIKLANDIIVNNGNAEDWAKETKVPLYTWTPIGSSKSFNGVFDGDMHTISGIYLDTTAAQSGLFSQSDVKANIQELKLCNSYLKTSNNNIGSIVGQAKGTFSKVYSDAIVKSSAVNVGGLIGRVPANSSVDMDECWYAGNVSVTNSISTERQIGGLIGYILASTSATSITNCLNSGTIDATSETKSTVSAGGLVGRDNSGNVAISNSLNVGLVTQSGSTTKYYGPIIGRSKTESLPMPQTYATTESSRSVDVSDLNPVPFTSGAESTVIDWDAATISSNLGDEWTKVDYKTPVLKVFKNENDGRIDISWFNEASYDTTSEYTLYDEEDLYGFTWICKDYDFSGKTVKLGADIVVNEGTASADWASKSNYRQWWPIGLKKEKTLNSFQGTFNGQGHTISGLYLDFVKSNYSDGRYAGLFAGVGETGIVENLRLTESYFQSNGREFGGIAGSGKGKFYNIYNSVIMNTCAYDGQTTDTTSAAGVGSHTCGGFIGMTSQTVVLDKCWFAGAVTNIYNNSDHQGTGGLIGYAYTGTVTMTNCLNSGTVKMDGQTTNDTARLGGLIGYVKIPVTMNACLNTKAVAASDTATKGYGPLVGKCESKVLVSMSATYVLDTTDIPEDITATDMNTLAQTTTYGVVTESDMKTKAATAMPLLNWSDDWKAVSNAMPELEFDYTTSVNGQKFAATSEEQAALANLYTGRTLFQGDMHSHASTYGRGQGTALGDDGTVSLTTWKEQLVEYDMDFAASLDHNQIDHIDHDDWATSKFVYGSEASATITDLIDQESSGKLHFDMIFKTKAQFESILNQYKEKFSYTGVQHSDDTWFTFNNMQFTKAQFATFIKDVYAAGGVVNIPHPLQGPSSDQDYSTELTDFIFDVKDDAGKQIIYGFHVITIGVNTGSSNVNYPAWENLLNKGYRIYATSGSDTHDDLDARALTSIYATTCKTGCDGSCEDTNCSAYDKGNMISQISRGDYVAGSVGIKMSIGDTTMGGSRTFVKGDRLVIGIGDVHNGYTTNVSDSETLRVDVMNEDGIVYSQKVVSGDTIALNVDADSNYYRVVIYNAQRSYLIAVGNPIWNDKN